MLDGVDPPRAKRSTVAQPLDDENRWRRGISGPDEVTVQRVHQEMRIDRAHRGYQRLAGDLPTEGALPVPRFRGEYATAVDVDLELLEIEDPIKGNYTLEVSSPGFDRILRKRAHFERFVGERIFAELKLPLDGRRRFVGTLKSIGNDSILVEVDGRPYELPLERIQKARLRPE